MVSAVGYKYKEASSSLGKRLIIELNGMPTSTHLNILPLRSYSMLLCIVWLYVHRNKVDYYYKTIGCLDENGEQRVLQGKKKVTSIRMVTTMQVKYSTRKECVLFVVHIYNEKGKDVEDVDALSRYRILQKFQDVSLVNISELLPHRDVDFSIEFGSRGSTSIKGTLQYEHTRVSGVEVVVE